MEIPPVLMQLLSSGQGLGKLFATSGPSAPVVSGEGQPFAFSLAQEAAPAIAAALGKPVVILPDGGILLEFDLANLPPGSIVVSPAQAHVDYSTAVAGEDAPDDDPIVEEDMENAHIGSFPFMLGPSPALSSRAKLLDEGTLGSEKLETLSAPIRSAAAYQFLQRSFGSATSVIKAALSADLSSAPAGSEALSEPSVVAAVSFDPVSSEEATIEVKTVANAVVPAPKLEGNDSNLVVLAKTAFGKENPEAPPPTPRGMPPPVAKPEGNTETEVLVSVSTKMPTGETKGIPLREALAYLTSEGVKLKVQTVDIETGISKAPTDMREGLGLTSAGSNGSSQEAVAELELGKQGQASKGGNQPSSDGSSEAMLRRAPVQALKVEELLDRPLDGKPQEANKAVLEPPVMRNVLDMPHREMPRVPTEMSPSQQTFEPASSISQHSGTPQAASEIPEYPAPRELAFRDSMADLAVKSVRYLVSEGEKSLRVRLVPESLGEIRVEIVSVRDELHLRLVSGNASVREAMEKGSETLRSALARDGVNIIRVTVAPDGGPSEGYGSFSGKSPADGQPPYASRHGESWNKSYGSGATASDERSSPRAYHEGLLSLYA